MNIDVLFSMCPDLQQTFFRCRYSIRKAKAAIDNLMAVVTIQ